MDQFEELKFIGRGNYGSAHLVVDKATGDRCVIKKIAIYEMSEVERDNAMQEVRLLKSLDHPNIVKYLGSFIEGSTLHIVMRYCEGGDLATQIKTRERAGNKYFSEDQILDWFVQLASAIQKIHAERVLHRDLKTSNVFLTKNNMVKLGDFGIARVLDYTMDHAKTVVGTPYYMSPEVCENKPYSFKSDMWALGCILYEMCTLRHAFDASNLLGLVYKIVQETQPPIPSHYSDDLRDLVRCMLAKDPDERLYPSQIFALPFIRARMKGVAASGGGTIGKLVVKMTPKERREARRQAERERREQELAEARSRAFQENKLARERGRQRMFRPSSDAHNTALTSGDTKVKMTMSGTAGDGRRPDEAFPRSPPPARPATVASGYDGAPLGHGHLTYEETRDAWGTRGPEGSSSTPHRPTSGSRVREDYDSGRDVPPSTTPSSADRYNPADDRPITACGRYAFERGGAPKSVEPAADRQALARPPRPSSGDAHHESKMGASASGAAAGSGGGASGGAAASGAGGAGGDDDVDGFRHGSGDDDSDAYSDDFEADSDTEYDPSSKARDEHEKLLFMRILESHIVDPDGAVLSGADVATPLSTPLAADARSFLIEGGEVPEEDEPGEELLCESFSDSMPPELPSGSGSPPVRAAAPRSPASADPPAPRLPNREKRLADLRESAIEILGLKLFDDIYSFLQGYHEARARGEGPTPREVQNQLLRFVDNDKRRLSDCFLVDQLLYEEGMRR